MPFTPGTAFTPRVRVAPPGWVAKPYGLLSVATPVDASEAQGGAFSGLTVEPDQYAAASTLIDGCTPAANRTKVVPDWPDVLESDPATVYAGWTCSTIGRSEDTANTAARNALVMGEERALEELVATGTSTNGEALAAPWAHHSLPFAPTVWPGALASALGVHEATVGQTYGGVAVFHFSNQAAAVLTAADLLDVRNGGLYTPSGHRATINPYLASDDDTLVFMVTGALQVYRGPIVPTGDYRSMDRTVNTVTRLAERTSVIVTDFVLADDAD